MLGSKATFARRLLRWYDQARRDLPWRANAAAGRESNPYHVLVSEAMLQQTQVATVVPYFNRFIARFGTLAELAAADDQEVLRLWQGLGYYSRARNLHATARKVVAELGGQLPRDVHQLLELPGIGRYTAGAVASIAFGRRAPILDGNVLRVLCRLDKIESDPRKTKTVGLLWKRAQDVMPLHRPGDFNSALMELGATVCTPRSPRCLLCPVCNHCAARAAGVQEAIPAPRKARPTPLFHRHVYCIRRQGEWLIEQRPKAGRWAGMWQFLTLSVRATGQRPNLAALPVSVGPPSRIGVLTHGLTHRRYHFTVFLCDIGGAAESQQPDKPGANAIPIPRAWVTLDGLAGYPLPRPHVKIAQMLSGQSLTIRSP